MTSHAAVVARGMGTCCVSGCGEIVVNYDKKQFTLGGKTIKEGDYISLDGSTGNVYDSAIPTVPATISGDFGRYMAWADKARRLQVYTNADTPKDAKQGREFGAEGIGLCRTEHMFFEGQRIKAMREMIVAETVEERKKALAKIMPYQQGDFEGLYTAMEGRPVIIRFLDPPLHEFLPTKEADIKEIAGELNITVEHLKERHCKPARVQPDDGSPRLPSVRHLSGNCRNADHGRHQRRHQRQQGASGLQR